MFAIGIGDNIGDVIKNLTDLERTQLPMAQATALTRTARAVNGAVVAVMPVVFDRPTRWTTGAFYVRPATKARLLAEVLSRQWAPKGTPGGALLRHWIEGGSRKEKRSETRLRAVGILPGGMLTAMGRDTARDQYGNMPAGQYVAMLSVLKASTDPYQNRKKGEVGRGKRGKDVYFVGGVGRAKHLKPGIYQRGGKGRFGDELMPTLMFMARPSGVSPRLPFMSIAERVSAEMMAPLFVMALDAALKSAKGGPIKSAYVDQLAGPAGRRGMGFSTVPTTREDSNWNRASAGVRAALER